MEKTNKFYVAELKKFDPVRNGFEFDSTISKGIFVRDEDSNRYINVLDPLDERSVYRRSTFYGEYMGDDQFGTKVVLDSGYGYDDYAWILTGEYIDTTLDEIEDYVLNSDDFYKDRVLLASEKLSEKKNLLDKIELYKILREDTKVIQKRKDKIKKLTR